MIIFLWKVRSDILCFFKLCIYEILDNWIFVEKIKKSGFVLILKNILWIVCVKVFVCLFIFIVLILINMCCYSVVGIINFINIIICFN